MPGYGVLNTEDGAGLLPWSWAVERLTGSHNYWMVTTRPDGRPHSMPLWGVWLDDGFCFSTGRQSRKGRNLRENPNCVVSTENAAEAVIVEGVAEQIADRAALKPFYEAYKAKYGWDLEQGEYASEPVYVVRPRIVFGIREQDFTSSATRWTFDAAGGI